MTHYEITHSATKTYRLRRMKNATKNILWLLIAAAAITAAVGNLGLAVNLSRLVYELF